MYVGLLFNKLISELIKFLPGCLYEKRYKHENKDRTGKHSQKMAKNGQNHFSLLIIIHNHKLK